MDGQCNFGQNDNPSCKIIPQTLMGAKLKYKQLTAKSKWVDLYAISKIKSIFQSQSLKKPHNE